jgi:hypothetical protein
MSGLQKPAGIKSNGLKDFFTKRLMQFSINYQLAVISFRLSQQMSTIIRNYYYM